MLPPHIIHPSFSLPSSISWYVEDVEFLDRNISGSDIPLLRILFSSDHKNRYIETVNFLLFARCDKGHNFTFWSCFLVERHVSSLNVLRSVMYSFKFWLSFGVSVSNSILVGVQTCWHMLTHWERVQSACIGFNGQFTNTWCNSNEKLIKYRFLSEHEIKFSRFFHTNFNHFAEFFI